MSEGARPHYAMWMFTGACPSACSYCDIDSQKGKKGLGLTEVERVCHDLLASGFTEVMFAGGEPLLSPHLPAALEILRGKVRTAVFTGGLPNLTDASIEILARGGVDRLVFSIDAGEAQVNDRLRGRVGVTRDLLEMAAAVRDRLPRIDRSVNTVVSRFNVENLEGVWDQMQPFGLNSWSLTLAGDFFEGRPSHALLDVDALGRLYFETIPRLALRLAQRRAELVVLPVPLPFLEQGLGPRAWAAPSPSLRERVLRELELFSRGEHNASFVKAHGCSLVGRDVVIGVGGEIHPCSQPPIIHPDYVVGNVRSDRLGEVLVGERVRAFAAGVPHRPCTRCWAPSNVPREDLARLFQISGTASRVS